MTSPPTETKLAIIGDIHGKWDADDTAYFNASDVDGLLFTGDMASFTDGGMHRVVDELLELRKPFALIAGNHDCVTMPALLGEVLGKELPSDLAAASIQRRYECLQQRLGTRLLAYSSTEVAGLHVVGARPFAMDGTRLSFSSALERLFGIDSGEASARRLSETLAGVRGPAILLSHNGPRGLGDTPDAPYGIDFRPESGDNGDADLAEAIAAHGDQVRLVVSGHMHHAIRGGKGTLRRYVVYRDGILYVNGARVPRHIGSERAYYQRVELRDGVPVLLQEVQYSRKTLQSLPPQVLWQREPDVSG